MVRSLARGAKHDGARRNGARRMSEIAGEVFYGADRVLMVFGPVEIELTIAGGRDLARLLLNACDNAEALATADAEMRPIAGLA